MSTKKKLMGLVAGAASVAAIGVAVAQGVPPDPEVANHAIAAGQQSSQMTSMGETGVPVWERQLQTAVIVPVPVAVAVEPEPAPVEAPVVVQAEPAPAPAEPATATMGAAPEPEPMEMAQAEPAPRADRN